MGWTYANGRHRGPRSDFYGSLDCSGFVRTVYGYRSGYPLEFGRPTGRALPRRAVMMAEDGPGATVVPNTHRQATDLARLQFGDLAFFNASPEAGRQVDHVGIYLGLDSTGHHRFISSRKTANGPNRATRAARPCSTAPAFTPVPSAPQSDCEPVPKAVTVIRVGSAMR
ncbi:NlpC/P60 family protein [Streptomyces violascens]|uniref:NlpC/P60 family protein n=1 Tax=Streptomyces violascens TaxID=67381 RepID=UPI00365C31B2